MKQLINKLVAAFFSKAKPWVLPFLMLTATACSSVYLPNARNVPMFSGKKEFQVSVQGQLDLPSTTKGLNVQTAYSLSNHVGDMANYAYASSSALQANSYIGEVGLGYFVHQENDVYYDCFVT